MFGRRAGGDGVSFSLRDVFGRRAQVPSADDARRVAQRHVDRGIAAEAGGAAADALACYRDAVAADSGFAVAHLNLGIALQSAGDVDAAVASYERAIALDPRNAAAHYNLGLAHSARSRWPEADAHFRAALELRADFPEAWVGLAGALEGLDRGDDALAALDAASALRSDYLGALLNAGALARKLGRLEQAVASDRRVLELEPDDHATQCRLGMSLQALGHLPEAEARYREALLFKPDYPEAKSALASLLLAKDRALEAIPLLFDVLAVVPTHPQLRANLAQALFGVALTRAGPKERQVLQSLCEDDSVSMLFIGSAIVALMKSDPGFGILEQASRQGRDPFAVEHPEVAAFLRDPLFLAALPRMTIADVELESVLTHLRRFALLRFAPESRQMDPAVPNEFICALARQCFYSGYAFFEREDEAQHAANVHGTLRQALAAATVVPRALEASLAISSLYDSLNKLKDCERLLAHAPQEWSAAFRPIITEQIADRVREREIAPRIAAITAIDDQVSLAVRAQYEENPYPRWVTVPTPGTDTFEMLSARLRPDEAVRTRPRPVPVLIAGCGTGHHPIQVARAYPDSAILAVDLSIASLAYAVRMTERFGVSNIAYGQADILRLRTLGKRFAVVECCGVLHHLDDPMAGWRVLVDLLESDGLMKIALYSATARSSVRAAREYIRSGDFPQTTAGIRRCRHAIMALPAGHPARDVMSFGDFFTLDEFRDLLMHVREHQFTLPQIAACLDELGLRLLQLECPPTVRGRFTAMYPDSDPDTDIAAWAAFEDTHPETFRAMYTFWCGRK